MDWGHFDAELHAAGAEERAGLRETAHAIVAAHGAPVLPKHVDAFVRAAQARGASTAELARAQRAGDALVRAGRRASSPPPVPDAPEAAGPSDAPTEAPPPSLPPEVLAQMPASYFREREHDDDAPWAAWLRRYAWALDAAAIAIGVIAIFVGASLHPPIGERPVLSTMFLERAVTWIGSLAALVGVAGFARRAGLLEGPLYDRLGNRTLKLRLLQQGALVGLRGVLALLTAGLVASILLARSCSDTAPPPRPDANRALRLTPDGPFAIPPERR